MSNSFSWFRLFSASFEYFQLNYFKAAESNGSLQRPQLITLPLNGPNGGTIFHPDKQFRRGSHASYSETSLSRSYTHLLQCVVRGCYTDDIGINAVIRQIFRSEIVARGVPSVLRQWQSLPHISIAIDKYFTARMRWDEMIERDWRTRESNKNETFNVRTQNLLIPSKNIYLLLIKWQRHLVCGV